MIETSSRTLFSLKIKLICDHGTLDLVMRPCGITVQYTTRIKCRIFQSFGPNQSCFAVSQRLRAQLKLKAGIKSVKKHSKS